VPADDEPDPEVTLLVPAVNEKITIEEFVAWCHEGLEAAGVKGEILIVDASSDETPELAVKAPGCCTRRCADSVGPTST